MGETTVKGKGTSGNDGIQIVKGVIDGIIDGEITGTQRLSRTNRPSASGEITLVTVGAAEQLKLYKSILNSKADFSTSAIILKIGTSEVGSLVSVGNKGQYMLTSTDVDFDLGALGEDLILTVPVGMESNCSINYSYEIV